MCLGYFRKKKCGHGSKEGEGEKVGGDSVGEGGCSMVVQVSFYFPIKHVGKTLELFVKEPHFIRALGVK